MRIITSQKLFDKYKGNEEELKALLLQISPNLDILPVCDYLTTKQHCDSINDDILIIGNHDVIPFATCPNPASDLDAQVYSDNPYLTDDNSYLTVKKVGTRIPDEMLNPTFDYIKKVLQNQIYFLNNKTTNIGWFNITAQAWNQLSGFLVNKYGMGALQTAPNVGPDLYKVEDTHKKIAYINCHGGENVPNFYGQNGNNYPISVTIRDEQFKNAIVAAECCYGANVINKNKTNSICLNALYSGSVSFFGSTNVAYGAADVSNSLSCADYLISLFFDEIIAGTPIGLAIKNAKIKYMTNLMHYKGNLSGAERKTLLQFHVYGLPNIIL